MPAKSRAQLQDSEIDELLTAIDKYCESLSRDTGLLLYNEERGYTDNNGIERPPSPESQYLDRFRDIVRTWVDKYAR